MGEPARIDRVGVGIDSHHDDAPNSSVASKCPRDARPRASCLVSNADTTGMSNSVQRVLVDRPVVHDQIEIPAGVSNQSEVIERIAIHHEKVGR